MEQAGFLFHRLPDFGTLLDDGRCRIIADALHECVLIFLVGLVVPVETVVVEHVAKRVEVSTQLRAVLILQVVEHLLLSLLDVIELAVNLHEGRSHEERRGVVGYRGHDL